MQVDRIVPIPDRPGMVHVWSRATGWPVQESDVEAFIEHMDDWYAILRHGPRTRVDYEAACALRGIIPVPDDALGTYGDDYGDFGMSHYHTEPANRSRGIAATLGQQRWRGLLRECPGIREERLKAEQERCEAARLAKVRLTYPADLDAWVAAVGGLEAIYRKAQSIHSNNSSVHREGGRHFEWLLGHACFDLGMTASRECPEYVAGSPDNGWRGVFPLAPQWWAGWDEMDPEHPLNKLAAVLSDWRIEPYMGRVTYMGYGEDCGDDVRQNAHDWLGI